MGLPLALAGCGSGPGAAAADRRADGALAGSRWQLQRLVSMSDEQPPVSPADPRRYTLVLEADGQLRVRLDCNRGVGTWQSEPAPDASAARRSGSLRFGPIATTRMACAPGSLAPRLVREWPHVRSYVLQDGLLHLALMADGGLQTWAPLPAGAADADAPPAPPGADRPQEAPHADRR